jgi:hypothetical protein
MRAKIRGDKHSDGRYNMICISPNGDVTYPQEGRMHKRLRDVYRDAYLMYGRDKTWAYNSLDHTIKID